MSLQQLRERIVNEVPISDLIQRYGVHLTRKSSGHVGVCPFHSDTKPSMSVSDDKRIYKCFACGAGTTHFDFVMNYKSLSFIEALKDICSTFGIDFEQYTDTKEKPKKVIYAEKILKAASEIYFQMGQKNKPQAYTDFLTNREIPPQLAQEYKLGFAPKSNTIYDYIGRLPAKDRNEALQAAVEIGLIKVDAQRQSHYDTFRDRITFPIWDHFGKVIGFQTRAIHDYQKAKYMNSTDSFIFNKRNLLYGLHFAKPFIRKRDAVILVEGNMDQIATFKKGFENSVAIMGTALGDNSLRTLKSLTKNIILALDSDAPGYTAATRVNRQFLQHGILPKYVEFSPYKDPDEYLVAEGAIALQQKLDEAKPFIDIQFENLLTQKPIEVLDEKLELLEQAFDILSPLKNSLKATERIVKWSKQLGLNSSPEKIEQNYLDHLAGQKEAPSYLSNDEVMEMESEVIPIDLEELNAIQMPQDSNQITDVEITLINALIEYPDCLEYDGLSELLDLMGSDGVKQYILKMQKLIFEIDQSEFKNFVLTISKDYGLEDVVRSALLKDTVFNMDRDRAKKFITDLEKTLKIKQLEVEKAHVKKLRTLAKTKAEQDALALKDFEIKQKLHKLK